MKNIETFSIYRCLIIKIVYVSREKVSKEVIMREKHNCPKCGVLTMGVPRHDGGYYLRCPDCLSEYFGGKYKFNENSEFAIYHRTWCNAIWKKILWALRMSKKYQNS